MILFLVFKDKLSRFQVSPQQLVIKMESNIVMFRSFIQQNFIDISSADRVDALILLPVWNWFC